MFIFKLKPLLRKVPKLSHRLICVHNDKCGMIFVFIVCIFAEGMIFFVVISSDEGSKYLKFENFITFFYLFYYLLVEVLHAKNRNY